MTTKVINKVAATSVAAMMAAAAGMSGASAGASMAFAAEDPVVSATSGAQKTDAELKAEQEAFEKEALEFFLEPKAGSTPSYTTKRHTDVLALLNDKQVEFDEKGKATVKAADCETDEKKLGEDSFTALITAEPEGGAAVIRGRGAVTEEKEVTGEDGGRTNVTYLLGYKVTILEKGLDVAADGTASPWEESTDLEVTLDEPVVIGVEVVDAPQELVPEDDAAANTGNASNAAAKNTTANTSTVNASNTATASSNTLAKTADYAAPLIAGMLALGVVGALLLRRFRG